MDTMEAWSMIKTVCIMVLLLPLPAMAQQVCTTTCDPYSNVCTSVCTPIGPGITHRYNPEAERALREEQRYYDRAQQYELWRLDRENRR
jgi:hypothetical protein